MKFSRHTTSLLMVSLLISCCCLLYSCSRSEIIRGSRIKREKAGRIVSLIADAGFHATFPEVLNAVRLQIVCDTILIVQDQAGSADACHFKAYSLNTFEYLGAAVRNGRGPGEMVNPHIAKVSPESRYLNIGHNQTGEAYSLDILQTLNTGKTVISHTTALPPGTMDWIPLPDMRHFILQSERGTLVLRCIGDDGIAKNTFRYIEELEDERHITQLSCLIVGNESSGEVAEAMMFFPVITVFDTKNGTSRSIATDKSYGRWKSLSNRMIDKDTKQYYAGASAGRNHIAAAYKNCTLEELAGGNHSTSIHVFDWKGNFLYDINVKEDIRNIAFDDNAGYLYGIDGSEGKIIRYDLVALLP